MYNVYQFACTKFKVPGNSAVHISLQNFEVVPKLLENMWTPATHHFSVKKNHLHYICVASPQSGAICQVVMLLVCRDSFHNMCTGNRELQFGSVDD